MKRILEIIYVCSLCTMLFCGCSNGHMTVISSGVDSNSTVSDDVQNSNLDEASKSQESDDADSSENEDYTQVQVTEVTEAVIYVFVCGAVQHEGVYQLPVDARADDALEAAGGFTENANTSYVNLARLLTDGEQLYFPEIGEDINAESMISENISTDNSGDDRINLNTATKEQLTSLSGIGDVKAENIIAYRDTNGSFSDTEDIMNVDGIGQALYDKIKDKIYIQ